jgi:copper chaperone
MRFNDKETNVETIVMKVNGMSCGGCVANVTRVLRAVPGVETVNVALQPGTATVSFDPARTGRPALQRAVEDAGYEVAA